MFSYRLLTAIILIPLVIWGIFVLPQLAFSLITAAIVLYAAWEWAQFMGWNKVWLRLLYVAIVAGALIASLLIPPWISFAVGALWWIFALCQVAWTEIKKKVSKLPSLWVGLIGLFALIPCWQAIIVLHLRPKWLLLLFLIVWSVDTVAYCGGKLWGKRKLAPIISPNKTQEGLYTVLAVSLCAVLLAQWWLLGGVQLQTTISWGSLVTVTVLAAIVGDLYESLLKRQRGLKDSGHFLPGHGGLLDRIDSLTAAAPVFICSALSLRLI